jgi:hypothetical protein
MKESRQACPEFNGRDGTSAKECTFAWIGHFFLEKNRPATFTYPLYSFMGDWVMFKDIITGKIKF